MKLRDLKPGDVFETRSALDGSPARFIRTGVASWERNNVMSTASFLPGTMNEKTNVTFIGRLQLKREEFCPCFPGDPECPHKALNDQRSTLYQDDDPEMRAAERAVYGSVCRLCNRDIKGKLKVANIDGDGWPACNECYKMNTPPDAPAQWRKGDRFIHSDGKLYEVVGEYPMSLRTALVVDGRVTARHYSMCPDARWKRN